MKGLGGLRSGNLGRHRPLALQFVLIPIKRLLPAIFKVGAVMVLRQTVRAAELVPAVGALADDAQGSGTALGIGVDLELAALLSSHDGDRTGGISVMERAMNGGEDDKEDDGEQIGRAHV